MKKADITSLAIGFVLGIIATVFLTSTPEKSPNDLITEYYAVETAVSVSPYDIKTNIMQGKANSFILVDVRSQAEYEEEHIVTALNIPIYVDPAESGKDNSERIIEAFRELKNTNPNTDIITYCYSAACMAARKVGNTLAENGIFVKHLNIGWNEWRYHWDLWNGPNSGTFVEDFVISGTEPGEPKIQNIIAPCGEGEFAC